MNDLSALSKTGNVDRAGTLVAGQKNDVAIAGGQILGDEWSDHVVKVGRTELAGQRKRLICYDCFFTEPLGYHLEGEVRVLFMPLV